jgi:hypothetical protein
MRGVLHVGEGDLSSPQGSKGSRVLSAWFEPDFCWIFFRQACEDGPGRVREGGGT